MPKWLSRLGALASQAANFITFVGVSWVVVTSAVAAIIVACFDKLNSFVHLPNVQAGGIVFLFVLWTYIGIYMIASRNKTLLTKRVVDISYGLSLVNLFFLFEKENENILQFGVNIQNYSGEALRYKFVKFDVTLISRRTALDKDSSPENIITFGGSRAFMNKSYPKSEIESFFGKDISGTVDIELEYGSLQGAFTRRLVEEMTVNINFKNIDSIKWHERILTYKEFEI